MQGWPQDCDLVAGVRGLWTAVLLALAVLSAVVPAAGAAMFSPAVGSPFGVGSFPVSVAVGDFNGDGHSDLVVADAGETA